VKSCQSFQRKDHDEELNYEELRNLRKESMNPHQKNFEEFMESSNNNLPKSKEINEAQDEEEEEDEDEKKEQMCDFDRFLNDMDDK